MLSKNRRNGAVFFGLLYLSFGAGACYAQDKPDEIKALLKERRELLSEAATQMAAVYLLPSKSRITVQDVVLAERDSLKADLDWFEKPEDRIKALETHKNAADRLLEAVKLAFNAAREPKYAVSQAKAYVLEVQIELLKEKEKQKPKANPKPGK